MGAGRSVPAHERTNDEDHGASWKTAKALELDSYGGARRRQPLAAGAPAAAGAARHRRRAPAHALCAAGAHSHTPPLPCMAPLQATTASR
jgi:hypothetical protein